MIQLSPSGNNNVADHAAKTGNFGSQSKRVSKMSLIGHTQQERVD